MATTKHLKVGEDLWKTRTEKINAELFTMTYGALVVQLIQDYEDYAEVNKQLDLMGYNIGTRLIEDFLARSNTGRCADFKEVGEVVAKIGFKNFLKYCTLRGTLYATHHIIYAGDSTVDCCCRTSTDDTSFLAYS